MGGTSRYRFAHGLVNETIYQDMGPAQRARTHHLIAKALDVHHGASPGPHVLEVAAHWFHAVPAAPARTAVEHGLKAALWGAEHVAHQGAIQQLKAALEVIADMPDGVESAMLELQVQDLLSVLLIASTSYTDPEFGQVCDRIRELSLRVEDDALLVPALWRLSMHHFMRCDVDAGRDVGHQLLDLPAAVGPGAAQVTGQIALALSSHVRGAQAYARRHFEEAVSLCDAGHDAGLAGSVADSPATVARTFKAIVAWLLGDEDQAETEALSSFYHEAAIDVGSWATMISVWGASTVSMLRRDAPATMQRCDDGIALAISGGYGLGVPYMTVNRGWAIALLGDTEVGESEIVRGTALAEAFGAEYMRAYFRAARAEVCLLSGRVADALAVVEEGLTIVESTGDRFFEAELYRLRGEAVAHEIDLETGVNDVEKAIAIAAAQGALGLERRARASLSQLQASAG